MTSDDSGLNFQMPGPDPRIGEESCRESGSSKPLEGPWSCPTNAYYYSGFTAIQSLIDNEWIKEKHAAHEEVSLEVRTLPKPGFSSSMETILRAMVPIYLTFSMAQFIGPMLMVVVDEKEKRIKESLRMVGLRDSAFWLSWFLVYALLISCTSLIASILVNFVIFNTTSTYYWILLPRMLTFGLSIIMFAFMLTAMFRFSFQLTRIKSFLGRRSSQSSRLCNGH
jgi:ATP-binding cassette subfamily A (ABC1) protein 5